MTVRQKFQKALMLLDRGAIDRGEETLREVISESETMGDEVAFVQGLICLGDLLYETGRLSEARPLLERAVQKKRDDDLLSKEFDRANMLLKVMSER
ncbi:hypothetical protein [Pseudoduganella armeniaca]|uniref:Tetratricopeptide repeat protein n=1 Tax=Pseudoduganella armeniaca TaxID=2072590 RepID=A0A2R4CA42_9BURK|nr:hypothetical protein [Pseudoduganella armeniaca]AVR96422.1 hypothetical protein C9I28_12460 [Pseudoduganella armeniaca]